MTNDKAIVDTKIVITNGINEKINQSIWSFPQISDLNPFTLLSSNTLGTFLTHIKVKGDNYDQ